MAVELNEKWHSQVPKEWELAFLPVESEEGRCAHSDADREGHRRGHRGRPRCRGERLPHQAVRVSGVSRPHTSPAPRAGIRQRIRHPRLNKSRSDGVYPDSAGPEFFRQ